MWNQLHTFQSLYAIRWRLMTPINLSKLNRTKTFRSNWNSTWSRSKLLSSLSDVSVAHQSKWSEHKTQLQCAVSLAAPLTRSQKHSVTQSTLFVFRSKADSNHSASDDERTETDSEIEAPPVNLKNYFRNVIFALGAVWSTTSCPNTTPLTFPVTLWSLSHH